MKLECKDTQRMISAYLAGTLDDRQCAAFLNHVKSCAHCREELETQFMIDYFLKYMDADAGRSFDIRKLLNDHLRRSELKIQRHRVMTALIWAILLILGLFIGFMIVAIFWPDILPVWGQDFWNLLVSLFDGIL